MPFSNPVVAGEELVRSAIRSENWSDGTDGQPGAGWKISRDGDATFNSVDIRGSIEGDSGSFTNASVTTSFTYQGEELSTLLDGSALGIVCRTFIAAGVYTAAASTPLALLELGFTARPGRTYRISFDEVSASSNTTGASMLTVLRYTIDGSQPTVSGGTGIELGVNETKAQSVNGVESLRGSFIFQNAGAVNLTVRVLLYIVPFGGNMTAGTRDTDMWVEDIGLTVGDTGIIRFGGGTTPTKSFRSFEAGWQAKRTYDSGGSYNTDVFCYQGLAPSTSSKRVGWAWFAFGAVGSPSIADLAGVGAGDIQYIDAFLYYDHWYNSGGGTCILGHHNVAAIPGVGAGEPAGGIVDEVHANYTARGQGQWFSLLGTNIGNAILAGTFRGFITGDHAINPGHQFYGYASDLKLRAGYFK